ncbi:MAG: hypothetical protein IT426_10970 [Pirellulales bacterium]|nr:hypothetical protein [Pirellulales bacterium]
MEETAGLPTDPLPPQEPLYVLAGSEGIKNREIYSPPRLGIIHLLGWVTFAAILMKLIVAMEMLRTTTDRSQSETFKLAEQILSYSKSILMAAVLVGGIVFYYDRFRRKSPGTLQPGHWLIAVSSVSVVCNLLLWSGINILQVFESRGMFSTQLYLSIYGLMYLGMAIPFIFAAKTLAERGRWRWVMIYLILAYFSQGAFYLLGTFFFFSNLMRFVNVQCCGYPLMLLLLIATITDLVRRISRDWLHWLGAVFPMATFVFSILWHVLYNYLRQSDLFTR